MFNYKTYVSLVCLFLVASCGDLFFPPLEVVDVSIAEGYVEAETVRDIKVVFSAPVSLESLEKASSLTENGVKMKGSLSAEGDTLNFTPLENIKVNRDYILSITSAAEDVDGNSLEKDFKRSFTTKKENISPFINEIQPADTGVIDNEFEEIKIVFSESVDRHSFSKAFSIEPSYDFFTVFSEDDTTVTIIPKKALTYGERYIVSVDTALTDMSGNNLKEKFSSSFIYSAERETPLYRVSLKENGVKRPLSSAAANEGVPPDGEFVIEFDKKMLLDSLSSFISVEPQTTFKVNVNKETAKEASIKFSAALEWGATYKLKIKEGIKDAAGNKCGQKEYVFITNKESCRPPVIAASYIDIDPGAANDNERFYKISDYELYATLTFPPAIYPTSGSAIVSTAFYLVAGINNEAGSVTLPSAMRALRIYTTNSCMSISINKVSAEKLEDCANPLYERIVSDDAASNPDYKYYVLKYNIEITNKDVPGFINFSVSEELKDNLGNTLERDWLAVYNKG